MGDTRFKFNLQYKQWRRIGLVPLAHAYRDWDNMAHLLRALLLAACPDLPEIGSSWPFFIARKTQAQSGLFL